MSYTHTHTLISTYYICCSDSIQSSCSMCECGSERYSSLLISPMKSRSNTFDPAPHEAWQDSCLLRAKKQTDVKTVRCSEEHQSWICYMRSISGVFVCECVTLSQWVTDILYVYCFIVAIFMKCFLISEIIIPKSFCHSLSFIVSFVIWVHGPNFQFIHSNKLEI